MPQTEVLIDPLKSYTGQENSTGPRFTRAGIVEGAGVKHGWPLKRGTNKEKQVSAFIDADTPDLGNVAGVLLLDITRDFVAPGAPVAGDTANVQRLGIVKMPFAAAVTAGQVVEMRPSVNELRGLNQGAANTASFKTVPGLRIVQTTTAAGDADVEIALFGA